MFQPLACSFCQKVDDLIDQLRETLADDRAPETENWPIIRAGLPLCCADLANYGGMLGMAGHFLRLLLYFCFNSLTELANQREDLL